MKYFHRLRICWQLLRARRAVVFIPAHPVLHLGVCGTIPPAAWEAIVHYAMREHAEAEACATARLLAAMRTVEIEEEQAALLATARALVAGAAGEATSYPPPAAA